MDKLAKNLVKLAKILACSWAFFFIAVILTLMSKGHSFQSIAMILVIISGIVSIALTSATLFAMCTSKVKQQKANADDRRNVAEECPIRIEGERCFAAGRLCAEIDRPTCEALRCAYTCGRCDGQNGQEGRRNARHEFMFPDGSFLEIIGPPNGPCETTYVEAEEE